MPKLAEALLERKALQEKFKRLCARLVSNAKVQEGEQPDEHPSDLLQEAGQVLADIKRLTMEINGTNMVAPLPGSSDGTTLMGAIAERDRLRDERNMLEQLGNAGRVEANRGYAYGATRNEIKWKATVNVAEIQRQVDSLAQSYRLLDTRIQEANWLTELNQN